MERSEYAEFFPGSLFLLKRAVFTANSPMYYRGSSLPHARRPTKRRLSDRYLRAVLFLAATVVLVSTSAMGHTASFTIRNQDSYRLTITDGGPPESLENSIAQYVEDQSLTVLNGDNEPLMDLWFARQLPAPTDPNTHPGVAYSTLNEGVVLAVMRLHQEHNDFRDQPVGAGIYLARYLRQPDDGNHLGETTYRDYAVLTTPKADSVGPQGFEETLNQALDLNLHPFAWGLWPANEVVTESEPGIAAFQPDKWAVKLSLPREDGSSITIAMVVAGNEWHY